MRAAVETAGPGTGAASLETEIQIAISMHEAALRDARDGRKSGWKACAELSRATEVAEHVVDLLRRLKASVASPSAAQLSRMQ